MALLHPPPTRYGEWKVTILHFTILVMTAQLFYPDPTRVAFFYSPSSVPQSLHQAFLHYTTPYTHIHSLSRSLRRHERCIVLCRDIEAAFIRFILKCWGGKMDFLYCSQGGSGRCVAHQADACVSSQRRATKEEESIKQM